MTRSRTSVSFIRDLPGPECISLHQALLVRCGVLPSPIPESAFRAIESFPPPDDLDEKRLLILAIAVGHVCPKGELWQMRQVPRDGEGEGPEQRVKLIDKEYQAPSDLWTANKICFGTSELRLDEPPPGFNGDRVEHDFFKLARIVVRSDDVENLNPLRKAKSAGGRPMKESVVKISSYVGAHIHHVREMKRSALIEAAKEYQKEQLPEKLHLSKSTIDGIVKEHLRQIDDYNA